MNYMKRIDNLIGSTPVAAVCNAAGQVDEILILRHLRGKSGVRQEPAVLYLVAGERAFKRGGVILVQVSVHVHGAVRQNRL